MESTTSVSVPAEFREVLSRGIFSGLAESSVAELWNHMELLDIDEGQTLFRPGEPADCCYVVLNGDMVSVAESTQGEERVLEEIKPGDLVGELFAFTGETRTSRVRAKVKCKVGRLSQQALRRLEAKDSSIVGKMAETTSEKLRKGQLTNVLPVLFGSMDPATQASIEHHFQWCRFSRGDVLFRQGDTSDSLYILVTGRLRVTVKDQAGQDHVVGEVMPGESVGEMAVLTGDRRSATVTAFRDSQLVRLSQDAFEIILSQHPMLVKGLARVISQRLRRTITCQDECLHATTVAVLAPKDDELLDRFVERLSSALAQQGETLRISGHRLFDELGIRQAQADSTAPFWVRLGARLDEEESRQRFVVYDSSLDHPEWTATCVRRADRILVIRRADKDNRDHDRLLDMLAQDASIASTQKTLVLIHAEGTSLPAQTSAWLSRGAFDGHLHIRWDNDGDFARLARIIAGRAVGLVLGGGGARGFAHLGAIVALREAGIPVDLVGGTSMGALIASQHALGREHEEIVRIMKDDFIPTKPFKDFTLPLLSLIKGSKLERVIKIACGDASIEDLWLTFFCVSSNLTTAGMVIHQQGPLWQAIRATTAIPGITAPMVLDNHLLVDGAILNNVPADIMRKMCPGFLIVVDVGATTEMIVDCDALPSPWRLLWDKVMPFRKSEYVPTIIEVLMRTTMLNSIHKTQTTRMDADLFLRPPVGQFKLLEFDAIDRIIEVGYQFTKATIEKSKTDGTIPAYLCR